MLLQSGEIKGLKASSPAKPDGTLLACANAPHPCPACTATRLLHTGTWLLAVQITCPTMIFVHCELMAGVFNPTICPMYVFAFAAIFPQVSPRAIVYCAVHVTTGVGVEVVNVGGPATHTILFIYFIIK